MCRGVLAPLGREVHTLWASTPGYARMDGTSLMSAWKLGVSKPIRILFVEDVQEDMVMINQELRKAGFILEPTRVETREEFESQLDLHFPDVIISDHGLPQFDGFAALHLAQTRCPDVPFIFVTGSLGERVTIEAFERGATDYVLKSDLSKLGFTVHRALQEAAERAELKLKE